MQEAAGRMAREVVGLYGDPDTNWCIGLDTTWSDPVGDEQVVARLERLTADHPHLGPVPGVERVSEQEWGTWRAAALSTPFERTLIRLGGTSDGRRLMVAAHHGAVDGLGMVALLAAAAAREITTSARGIGDRSSGGSFLRASAGRLLEAVADPPPRLHGHPVPAAGRENVGDVDVPRMQISTGQIAHAAQQVYAEWPGSGGGRPLFFMGVSRRPPGRLAPDRQTGYVRFRVDPAWDLAETRERFAGLAPEPDFPETSVGGLAPRLIRLFRNRLGSTAQISNLGSLEAVGLESAALFPALSGPSAVSFGFASTASTTSATVRTRTREYSAAETCELLDRLVSRLRDR
jgi:hypothetical protein